MRGADSAGIINPDPILPGAPKPIGVEVSMEKKGARNCFCGRWASPLVGPLRFRSCKDKKTPVIILLQKAVVLSLIWDRELIVFQTFRSQNCTRISKVQ